MSEMSGLSADSGNSAHPSVPGSPRERVARLRAPRQPPRGEPSPPAGGSPPPVPGGGKPPEPGKASGGDPREKDGSGLAANARRPIRAPTNAGDRSSLKEWAGVKGRFVRLLRVPVWFRACRTEAMTGGLAWPRAVCCFPGRCYLGFVAGEVRDRGRSPSRRSRRRRRP